MKLKINKACDLNSISVLPPHARNPCAMHPGADGLGRNQLRSQSQQSFSQGMPFSQLSQNSFDDTLVNEQKFGSQERENSSRRSSSLAPITTSREESQLQLSRTSNNALQRWKLASAPVPDNRCQFGEEIDRRIRQMEGLLNRLGMILDTVQSDVMQVNRAVKEVSLETEGIRQKIFLLDNSMQQVLKGEENVKSFLDRSLKSFPDELIKKLDCSKLTEIAATVSDLPKQIEANLQKYQTEVCMVLTKEMKIVANDMQTLKDKCFAQIQSPESRSYLYTRRHMNSLTPSFKIPIPPPKNCTRKASPLTREAGKHGTPKPKPKPRPTASMHSVIPKKEEIQFAQQDPYPRIVISDEESDGEVSCLLVKKETGKASILREEAEEETIRILRRARKRKRRQNNFLLSG